MPGEELLEYGIVKSSEKGYAVVVLQQNENCNECTAKIFCKSDKADARELLVIDSRGAAPGSKVLISVSGRQILNASFKLYGIPLLLILCGIFGGAFLFTTNAEIYSAITGLGLAAAYFFVISRLERNKERVISKIVYDPQTGSY